MIVRALNAADAWRLAALAARESPGFDLAAQGSVTHSVLRVVVPRDGQDAIGYAIERWLHPEVELLALAVEPWARRRGAARSLLVDLLDRARAAQCERITLEVRSGNQPARALYAALGFRDFGARRNYYRSTGEDALEMEIRPEAFKAEGRPAGPRNRRRRT